jgi:hypothetical protein
MNPLLIAKLATALLMLVAWLLLEYFPPKALDGGAEIKTLLKMALTGLSVNILGSPS